MSIERDGYFWDGEELRTKDEERIDEVLGLVRKVWRLHPDLRLGQLMEFFRPVGPGDGTWPTFYVPDEVLMQHLRNVLKSHGKS